MNVTGHDAPGIYLQSFFFLAKPQTVEQYIPVFISDKNIEPIDHRKTYKVGFGLVSELVSNTH